MKSHTTAVVSLLIGLFAAAIAVAAPVSSEKAKQVALNWMVEKSRNPHAQVHVKNVHERSHKGVKTHYDINVEPDGFVVVAADDVARPVWAYAENGSLDDANLPPAYVDWMEGRSEELVTALSEGIAATGAQALWERYDVPDVVFRSQLEVESKLKASASSYHPVLLSAGTIATPLWDQGRYYNAMCPADAAGSDGHVYTGCVATAMAELMRYWSYPTTGQGSHSYTHSRYGTLSADFGSTTYAWSSMPTTNLSAYNTAVAQLMFHCGVAVDMDYSPSGSGASVYTARTALVNNFRYSRSALYLSRSSYPNQSSWELAMRDELDAGRPIDYRGDGSGGHSFLVTGYGGSSATDNYSFYFNWGWGSYANGWFYLSALNPGGGNYTNNQGGIFQVIPGSQMPEPNLQASSVPTSINVGNYFDLYVAAGNDGQTATQGAIAVSFPSFTSPSDAQYVSIYDCPAGMTCTSYPAGGTQIRYRSGYGVTPSYLLVEGSAADWAGVKALTLRVQPKAVGTFVIFVRSAMSKRGAWVNSPLTSSYADQQGWEVTRYTVTVVQAGPTVTTGTATGVGLTGATLNGTVNPNGASTTTAFEYGATTSYGSSVTTATLTGGNVQAISANVTGLSCGSTYHFRTKATNSGGTAYGVDMTFTTTACPGIAPPTALTSAASSISTFSATLNGRVNANGSMTKTGFEYGTSTTYGRSVGALDVTGNAEQAISASLGGLLCATTYHFRAKATNTGGTTYGPDQLFTTGLCNVVVPTVVTTGATAGLSTATLNGTVNANSTDSTAAFEYGASTAFGRTTTSQTVSGAATRPMSATLTGLACGTDYYFRLRASNPAGTGYGETQAFATGPCPPAVEAVTDGGFESATATGNSAPGWVITASSRGTLIQVGQPYAHSGAAHACLGTSDYQTESLEQSVAIPSNATVANFSCWVNIVTQESTTGTAYDTLKGYVYDQSGRLLKTAFSLSNLSAAGSNNADGAYFKVDPVDLAAYKGTTVKLVIKAITDSTLPTTFRVDDVSVQIQTTADLPPATSVTAPSNGSTVAGVVNVSASASDDVKVGSLEIFIDGVLRTSNSNLTTLSYPWVAVLSGSGPHTIYSRATDGAGQSTTSSVVSVVVEPIAAPSNVTATATSSSAVTLTWGAVNGASSYQVRRADRGYIGASNSTSFSDTGLTSNTAFLYQVRAIDAAGNAGALSAGDIATTVIFTDDPVVAGMTTRAAHIAELRTAVNAVRALAGAPPLSVSEAVSQGTTIKAVHLSELRGALNAARSSLGCNLAVFSDATVTPQATVLKAIHIQELRDAVK